MDEKKPIKFRITGREPCEEETARLAAMPMGSGLPGGAEVADALKWFAVGIVSAVVLFFFGRWVISQFRGPGVLIFGYGFAYLVAPIMIIFGFGSLFKMFRSAHKKTAAAAGKWFWVTSVLGDDAVGARFGKEAYAFSTMRRMLPKDFDYREEEIGRYLEALHNAMAAAGDRTTAELLKAGWNITAPYVTWTPGNETEISPDLHRLEATIGYVDKLTKSDSSGKSKTIENVRMELAISQFYIRSGKFWFPYDLTPAFEEIFEETVPAPAPVITEEPAPEIPEATEPEIPEEAAPEIEEEPAQEDAPDEII